MSVVDGIGGTPCVELSRVVPAGAARVLAKLEFANPSGSMKDRMARAVVEAAERDGRLVPGGTVVEYTAGTTGISLALVCAAKGYPLRIVFSDVFSAEKGRMMAALGADITMVPGERGITERLVREMIETARAMSEAAGHWWVDQLANRDAIDGYRPLGHELWSQSGGRVDAFVHGVGTAHSIHGVAEVLRDHATVRIVAVEPAESPVLSGGSSGSHGIEGIGIGYLPPLWQSEQVDEVMAVSTEEAVSMARRLAREEGIFAGTSSGANAVAAIRIAERLGPEATVATIMCDSGLRYLSGATFRAT